MRRAIVLAALAAALAGCGEFEDPAIVRDLRPIMMFATPPEQVVAIDPANPTAVSFDGFQVCGVVGEPDHRPLEWRMVACPPQRDLRCTDLDAPFIVVDDIAQRRSPRSVSQMGCAEFPGGPQLDAIVRYTIEHDSLQGFGGVDINVSLRVAPVGAGEDEAVYAAKAVRFSAKLPEERVANRNPAIGEVLVQVDRGSGFGDPETLLTGSCLEPFGRLTVSPGNVVKIAPKPLDGAAEDYVVPTFEGGSRMFTENLRYNWLATGGGYSRDETGGPRDAAGNPPAISTEWRPPAPRDGEEVRMIDLWLVQHDERGGASLAEGCILVVR